jgi:hypothetical protein
MMAEAEAVVAIHHVTQPNQTQVVAALFIMSALREFVPGVGAGYIGIKVGRIIS